MLVGPFFVHFVFYPSSFESTVEYKFLVSKETVELCQWGGETLKLIVIKQVELWSNFSHEEIMKLMFQALALHPFL